MTTYAEALTELLDELTSAGLDPTTTDGTATPCTLVMPEGMPDGLSIRRQSVGTFRLTFLAGGWTTKGAVVRLLDMIDAFASVFAALPGWGVGPIEPPSRYRLANGESLGAAVTVSRMIDYPEVP